MHDPRTVAFEIPYFWQPKNEYGYRAPFITIWHLDPETDGTDDSCGWAFPKFTDEELRKIKALAKEEESMLTIAQDHGYKASAFDLIYWAWRAIAWRIYKRRSLPYKDLIEIIDLATNSADNLRHYCDPLKVENLFFCVCCCYKRLHRPWWKHPKWHVHHWRLQIHPLQSLKRWLFERCHYCGDRFSWGYGPVSDGRHTYHHQCHHKMYDIKMFEEK